MKTKAILIQVKELRSLTNAIHRIALIPCGVSPGFFIAFEKLITETLVGVGVSNQDLQQLALSMRIIPLDLYKIDLYKAVIKDKLNSFEKIHKKYIHLGVFDFMFAEKDVVYHKNQVLDLTKEDAKKRIDTIRKEYKNRKRELKKLAQKYKRHIDLLNLYRAFADVKEWKNFLREKINNDLKYPMKYVAEVYGCSLDEVALLTYEEIVAILTSTEKKTFNLTQRYKKSLFVFDKTNLFVVCDESIYDMFLIEQHNSEKVEIKGMVVFKGKVQGVVKIVVGERDFAKINEGDILVASTTRPDYLPVMQKSAGFITNEGGLLSHAAIVARELKKPCIIGTKIATKVLKDGDLVEVDAEKGMVRILKRAK